MIPNDTIDKLAMCFASLSELGQQLSEAQWKLPTECPGWTVQDNLSHIVAFERVLNGYPATTHQAKSFDYIKNPIGTSNENEIDARRHLSGAEVLAEWNETAAERLATLRSADEAYYSTEMMTPTGPGTIADLLHIRVLDCWVHEQDMRRTLGITGHLSGAAAEHTIDRLIRTIPIVVGKRASTPDGQSVVIDITADPVFGGVRRHIICTVINGRAALVDIEPEAPLCRLTMDTQTFLTLATGRRGAEQITNSLEYAGDLTHGHKVLASMNMMI